jgi:hypothetical protein
MVISQNVNRVLQEAKTLSLEEQNQLRLLLDEIRKEEPQLAKGKLDQLLLAEGVISRIPPKPTAEDIARFQAWKPIKIEGKPLSETIIEDRR